MLKNSTRYNTQLYINIPGLILLSTHVVVVGNGTVARLPFVGYSYCLGRLLLHGLGIVEKGQLVELLDICMSNIF